MQGWLFKALLSADGKLYQKVADKPDVCELISNGRAGVCVRTCVCVRLCVCVSV